MTTEPGAPPAQPIRVLIADDQPLLRRSLAIIADGEADLTVVGETGTGRETVAAARRLRPDVILMDIRMPDGDGIGATASITGDPALAATRVLILTTFELDEYVYSALRAGASGFLLKDCTPARLTDAVRRVHDGEALFAPTILTRLVGHYVRTAGPQPCAADTTGLTPREVDVLTLVGRGLSNDEIAAALHLSGNTVKTHVGHLLAKLAARDRTQLVIAAYDAGLVTAGR